MRTTESIMSRVTYLAFVLILVTSSSRVSSSLQQEPSVHNLRLASLSALNHNDLIRRHDGLSTSLPPGLVSLASSGKSRKVREVREGEDGDLFSQDYPALRSQHQQQQQPLMSSSPGSTASIGKVKGIYPPLSGSGELFRLFRPLALSPDKTIGMTRWYLPGFGYFSRGGRASSNFIRFGRSGQGNARYVEDANEDEASMLSRNSAKKKNNFIRLGRENPRHTNFIRLGRSGGSSPDEHPGAAAAGGEFYNSGYITPALSDPFRTLGGGGDGGSDDARQDFN